MTFVSDQAAVQKKSKKLIHFFADFGKHIQTKQDSAKYIEINFFKLKNNSIVRFEIPPGV